MILSLFQFIDETVALYTRNMPLYIQAEADIRQTFTDMLVNTDESIVSIQTRIKRLDSLKEKLIRKQFYLNYAGPEEALENLHDLIGVTLQCRFIRNETSVYQTMDRYFEVRREGYARCLFDENLYLNLRMPQPQLQRNGFTIYRLDGYYNIEGTKVNFELQLKSLVHSFWSEIEHEVVYKNPDFVAYDSFNKSMLAAIRDNLDVVDRQLEIMYNQISFESNRAQIGMDEKGFKIFVAGSINQLVMRKMKESVGFTTDFRKASAILAHFIYIQNFVNGEHNHEKMIDYLEHLNYLSESGIDFRQSIALEYEYHSNKPFCDYLGRYWQKIMNTDFQWHVFFVILFGLQPGNYNRDFADFCEVIRKLIIQPGWYSATFQNYSAAEAKHVQDAMELALAKVMADVNHIKIVHEDMLFETMSVFRRTITEFEQDYPEYPDFEANEEELTEILMMRIHQIYAKD